MSTNAYERVIINNLEKALSTDINELQSQLDRSQRSFLERLFNRASRDGLGISAGPVSPGFVGDGFRVTADGTHMALYVAPGQGFIYDTSDVGANQVVNGVAISGLDDLSAFKPLLLVSPPTVSPAGNIAVPAADPTNPRIDQVEVAYIRQALDQSTRLVLNPATGVAPATSLYKTLSFLLDGTFGQGTGQASTGQFGVYYHVGTPGATPSIPAVSPGHYAIAQVLVPAGSSAVAQNQIRDLRYLLNPEGIGKGAFIVSVASQAATAPAMAHVDAPPGVRVAAQYVPVSASAGEITCWILLPGGVADFSASIAVYDSGGNFLGWYYTISPTITNLSTTDASTLAGTGASPQLSGTNGAPGGPQYTNFLGHPVVKFQIAYGNLQTAAGGAATNQTYPVVMHCRFTYGY